MELRMERSEFGVPRNSLTLMGAMAWNLGGFNLRNFVATSLIEEEIGDNYGEKLGYIYES